MSTGFTQVTASHLQDATGTPITNATISFLPVANNGVPLSFRAGGAEGQVVSQAVTAQVTNGSFTITLADTSLTTPVNVGYRVSVLDNNGANSGRSLLGNGYGCIQPTGDVWSLDTYIPNVAAQVTVQRGPTGPDGLSAYQLYQQGGGGLSLTDWLASLHGSLSAQELTSVIGTMLTDSLPSGRQLFDYTAVKYGYIGFRSGTVGNDLDLRTASGDPSGDSNQTYVAKIPVAGLSYVTANVGLQAWDSVCIVFADLDGKVLSAINGTAPPAAGTPIAIPTGAVEMFAQCKGPASGGVDKTLAAFASGSVTPVWSAFDAAAGLRATIPTNAAIVTAVGTVVDVALAPDRQRFDWRQVPGGYLWSFNQVGGLPLIQDPGPGDDNTYVAIADVAGLSYVTANTGLQAYDGIAYLFVGLDGKVISRYPLPTGGIPAGTPIAVDPGAAKIYAQCKGLNSGGISRKDAAFKGGSSAPTYSPYDEALATDPYNRPYGYLPTNLGSTLNDAMNRGGLSPYRQARFGILGDSYVAFDTPNFINVLADYIGASATFDGGLSGRAWANWKDAGTTGVLNQAAVQNLDVLFIELGTNQNSTVGFGAITDTPGYGPSFSLCAQMVDCIATLNGWNPVLRIVGCTPTQTSRFNTSTSVTDLTGNADLNAPNNTSLIICKSIADTQKMVYGHFGIPVVDWHYESGIAPTGANTSVLYATRANDGSTDWVHPSPFARATRLYPLAKHKLIQAACI